MQSARQNHQKRTSPLNAPPHAAAAALLLLLTLALLRLPAPALAQRLTLEPVPPVVEQGRVIEFVGEGFRASERVDTWATAPDGEVLQGEQSYASSDGGSIVLTFRVPAFATTGRWAMTAKGAQSATEVIAFFEVVAHGTGDAPLPQGAQRFTLAPLQPSATAGQVIEFAAAGFEEGERITAWATDPYEAVVSAGDVFAQGERGTAVIAFEVPENALGGRWHLTAMGIMSRTPVSTPFAVQGGSLTSVDLHARVNPPAGPAGTIFAFAATGFNAKEDVSYWVSQPGGKVYAAYPEATESNGDGRVDITWVSPFDGRRGTWVMTIVGVRSGVERAIPFAVTERE